MPDYDDHSDTEGSVRRRHSAHHDRDDMDIIHARHGALPNEHPQSSPSTSGTDIPTHTTRESGERSPRVSFSLQEKSTFFAIGYAFFVEQYSSQHVANVTPITVARLLAP
jgi:hypothetical protein